MKLTLTEAALDDLRSIRAYTLKTWGEEQEEIYLQNIWSRIQTLVDDPMRYRLREELFPGCRIAAEGRHVILFHSTGDTHRRPCPSLSHGLQTPSSIRLTRMARD